jgi:predicted dehydrogenase
VAANGKVKIGLIGVGNISPAYIKGTRAFDILDLVAVSDIDVERAKARAKEFDIPKAYTVDELLADPEVEIVVNLTVPQSHAEVNGKIINAGKSAYAEKPFGLSRAEGKPVLDAAAAKKLLVGCAPDTFLGGGIQTCRKLIDEGAIGVPVAAVAYMVGHGPESWHPNPTFYYARGGGPMFDMGPYYLTALINLLGPVKRVTASARASFPERTATSKDLYGLKIPVEIPTHVAGVMDFESGAIGNLIMSFDVWSHTLPRIEIYGSEGSLSVPDPNTFGGPVKIRKSSDKDWQDVTLTHGYTDNMRGIGVADMAYALRSGRANRASGALAYHVLDLMQSFHDASESGKHINIESTVAKPAALPVGLEHGKLDD